MKNKDRKVLQIELANSNIDFFLGLLKKRFNPEFDKHYIRWYVVEKYGVDIVTDYNVNIIDDSINIFTLTNENKIVLHKNTYEIVNI